jgi:formylglycine-generating enzyme required for sulfatase activity
MKKWIMARAPILVIATAIISVAAHAQRSDTTDPLVRPNLETEVAELKAKTAAMVATALPRLAALSSQERLAAAPEIWRVPGAVTEFKDCANCPHMTIVPAGEFTMGSPPDEKDHGDAEGSAAQRAHPGCLCRGQIRGDEGSIRNLRQRQRP